MSEHATKERRRANPMAKLVAARSTFTMRDLLNIACADEPSARLEQVYRWYFERTMTAIRVSTTAAAATCAAIYGLVLKDPDHFPGPGRGLVVIAAVCVIASIFQRRELAQLHSELAAALRLLSELKDVPAVKAHDRPRADDDARLGWAGVVVGLVALVGVVCWAAKPQDALAGIAVVAAILAVLHMLAEFWPRKLPEGAATLQEVGDVGLDDYVFEPTMTKRVNDAMRDARKRPS